MTAESNNDRMVMKFIFSPTLWLNALKIWIAPDFQGQKEFWKFQTNRDYNLLCLKGKGNNPSGQRGRGGRACVGICAFWFEVSCHLRKTNRGLNQSPSQQTRRHSVSLTLDKKRWCRSVFSSTLFTARLNQHRLASEALYSPFIPSGSTVSLLHVTNMSTAETIHLRLASIKNLMNTY